MRSQVKAITAQIDCSIKILLTRRIGSHHQQATSQQPKKSHRTIQHCPEISILYEPLKTGILPSFRNNGKSLRIAAYDQPKFRKYSVYINTMRLNQRKR